MTTGYTNKATSEQARGSWMTSGNNVGFYTGYGTLLYLLFAIVYFGSNWISSIRDDHLHLYFDWELAIPFVPVWIYIYLSMSFFFLLPLLVMNRRELELLLKGFAGVTLAGGILLLVFPTESGWERLTRVPGYELAFDLLYALDLPYNLFPSMHVALTTFCMMALHRACSIGIAYSLILLWWGFLQASVLFVHQHHLVDIGGGVAVAELCYRWFYV